MTLTLTITLDLPQPLHHSVHDSPLMGPLVTVPDIARAVEMGAHTALHCFHGGRLARVRVGKSWNEKDT